jgi:hypothetical protein
VFPYLIKQNGLSDQLPREIQLAFDELFQLIQNAQKLTVLPDRKLPYIMTISQKRKNAPENVLLP